MKKEDLGEISSLIDSKIAEAVLALKGVTPKPKLTGDPDYNKDHKLHQDLDTVVMLPTEAWSRHGELNASIATHEAGKEFECKGYQADTYGKKGMATFVKVKTVYVKKATLNVTSQKLN